MTVEDVRSHETRGVVWVQGTVNMRPQAVLLSFAWLTAQSVHIWGMKWGFHCVDEQRTVKEAPSYSRQLSGFPPSLLLCHGLTLYLWSLSLWVPPYRPTYHMFFLVFLYENIWIFTITVTSLCQVTTLALGSYLLFGFLLCSETWLSNTFTCFVFLQLVTYVLNEQLNVIPIC